MNETITVLVSAGGALIMLLISGLFFFVKGKFRKLDDTKSELMNFKIEIKDRLTDIKLALQKNSQCVENFTDLCDFKHKSIDHSFGEYEKRICNLEKKT
jgi:hypothetical protein